MPLPHPISRGSISHGMPLLRTKTIPVSTARSGTRGRPPFGFGGSGGSSDSTTAQSSSVTNAFDRFDCTPHLRLQQRQPAHDNEEKTTLGRFC